MIQDRSLDPVYASDRTYKEGELPPLSLEKFVSPGFFKTMGIPLIAGRDMTWQEELEKRPVAHCLGKSGPQVLGLAGRCHRETGTRRLQPIHGTKSLEWRVMCTITA